MSVSLNAVGAALSKSGPVTIAGATENGYTRTHASSGYARINPFQVEGGTAPSEFIAPHTLGDWANYAHASLNTGSALAATASYGEVGLTWTLPAGYSRDTANLTQRLYWKDMGTTEDLNVNPFSTSTGSVDVGDVTSYTLTGLTAGHYYAIGLKVEWDDSLVVRDNVDSDAYQIAAGQTALIGGGRGLSSGKAMATAPTIDSVVQLTDPATCLSGCTSCVDVKLNVTMEGSSTGRLEEKKGTGAWTLVDSAVTAGSTAITLTARDSNVTYQYRLRYNDVSPDTWSDTGSVDTVCTLI